MLGPSWKQGAQQQMGKIPITTEDRLGKSHLGIVRTNARHLFTHKALVAG